MCQQSSCGSPLATASRSARECPAATAGGPRFRRQWWQYQRIGELRHLEGMLLSMDCAFKGADGSDFVVIQCWGRKGADCYLLDQVRERMDFAGTQQALIAMHQRWPQAALKLVEDAANGPAIIASLKQHIPGLVPVLPLGSKQSRAQAVLPMIEAGNVFLPDPTEALWVGEFIEECSAFPVGAHDDQVDAMTQALLRFQARRETSAFGGKPLRLGGGPTEMRGIGSGWE